MDAWKREFPLNRNDQFAQWFIFDCVLKDVTLLNRNLDDLSVGAAISRIMAEDTIAVPLT